MAKKPTKSMTTIKTPRKLVSKKPVLKKPVLKKPVLKKVVAKKPVLVKKATAKKIIAQKVKPASIKRTAKIKRPKIVKRAAQPAVTLKTAPAAKKVVKKAAVKTPFKAPAKARKAPSTARKAKVQAQVNTVAERLKRADSTTRKNIRALETDFTALALQMSRTKSGHSRLTRRVTELSKTLRNDLSDMQADVSRDLARALNNPTLDTLQSALAAADMRISESEHAQSAAVARINRHIADIATIVETKLSEETQARQTAMAEMKAAQAAFVQKQDTHNQAMKLRFGELQSESAEAIRTIGDKVVDVAEEMGRRREHMATTLRQEMNEAALATRSDFEQFRRQIERRLEALETEGRTVDERIERSVSSISSRVEGLEYGLSAPAAITPISEAPALPPVPQLVVPQLAVQQEDAFSPEPVAPAALVTPPTPLVAAQIMAAPTPIQAVPYDPQAFPSAAYPAQQASAVQANPYPQAEAYAEPAPYEAPTYEAPTYEAPTYEAPTYEAAPYTAPTPYTAQIAPQAIDTPPFPPADQMPIADDALPYADPAYSEGPAGQSIPDQSMKAARPGAFDSIKKIGKPKFLNKAKSADAQPGLLTPRNLKLGGMVAAVGLIGFIGAQTLIKNDTGNIVDRAPLEAMASAGFEPANMGQERTPILSAGGQPLTQETIGQYSDNRKMAMVDAGSSDLAIAANAGNPIAQLQLGLSKIEGGALEDGVTLIRAAAGSDQPAALYRLAKLYETGQGVGQDAKTAHQLTERSARGGNRIAMHDLALYYTDENGVIPVDMLTAAKWFEKAAKHGVVDSQFNLGLLLETGQGLEQDMEAALFWYSIAGAQGDQMAAGRVGILRKALSQEQLTRADARIAAFTPTPIDEQANGIFKDLPWVKTKVADAGQTGYVRQTQSLLNELGYKVGAADGAIGPKTRNAIMSFERGNGLPETGRVNAQLIERLELAAGA